jgi:hypothetical protein
MAWNWRFWREPTPRVDLGLSASLETAATSFVHRGPVYAWQIWEEIQVLVVCANAFGCVLFVRSAITADRQDITQLVAVAVAILFPVNVIVLPIGLRARRSVAAGVHALHENAECIELPENGDSSCLRRVPLDWTYDPDEWSNWVEEDYGLESKRVKRMVSWATQCLIASPLAAALVTVVFFIVDVCARTKLVRTNVILSWLAISGSFIMLSLLGTLCAFVDLRRRRRLLLRSSPRVLGGIGLGLLVLGTFYRLDEGAEVIHNSGELYVGGVRIRIPRSVTAGALMAAKRGLVEAEVPPHLQRPKRII